MLKKQVKSKPEAPLIEEEEDKSIDLSPIVDKLVIMTITLEKLNSDLSSILTKVVTNLDTLSKKEAPEVDNSEISNKLLQINQTLGILIKKQDIFNQEITRGQINKSNFTNTPIVDNTEEKRLLGIIVKNIQDTNDKLNKEPVKKTWEHQVFKDENGIYKVISTSR